MNYDAEAFTLEKKWDRRVYFPGVKSFYMRVSVLDGLLYGEVYLVKENEIKLDIINT